MLAEVCYLSRMSQPRKGQSHLRKGQGGGICLSTGCGHFVGWVCQDRNEIRPTRPVLLQLLCLHILSVVTDCSETSCCLRLSHGLLESSHRILQLTQVAVVCLQLISPKYMHCTSQSLWLHRMCGPRKGHCRGSHLMTNYPCGLGRVV